MTDGQKLWVRFRFDGNPSTTRPRSERLTDEVKKLYPLATTNSNEAIGGRDLYVWIPCVAYEEFKSVLYLFIEGHPCSVEHGQISN